MSRRAPWRARGKRLWCGPNGPVILHCYDAAQYVNESATDIIHELGHLIIGGDSIRGQDEVKGPGLALDHAHCRLVRVPFLALMADFSMDKFDLWPNVPTAERGRMLAASRAVAVARGLLTADGRPTYVRYK